MANYNWPSIATTAGPTQFVLDSSNQAVTKDTASPTNSVPFPVEVLDDGIKVDFATSAKQDAQAVLTGAVAETAPATDTASSGLNGRLQRIAQRLTSLIALLPSAIGQNAKADSLSVTLASDQVLPLPTGASTSAKQDDQTTLLTAIDGKDFATSAKQDAEAVLIGAVTETAPASDTASSGLNGRLQRIAQNITSLIGLFPTSIGQKAMAGSLSVTVASDQSAIPASQSGTWTVQPGNTANTTAWLVTQGKSSTGTLTTVAGTSSTTTLLAANSSRLGAMFSNDSIYNLYLKLGSSGGPTSYTVMIPPNGYYEVPGPHLYTGIVTGAWTGSNGYVYVTELT